MRLIDLLKEAGLHRPDTQLPEDEIAALGKAVRGLEDDLAEDVPAQVESSLDRLNILAEFSHYTDPTFLWDLQWYYDRAFILEPVTPVLLSRLSQAEASRQLRLITERLLQLEPMFDAGLAAMLPPSRWWSDRLDVTDAIREDESDQELEQALSRMKLVYTKEHRPTESVLPQGSQRVVALGNKHIYSFSARTVTGGTWEELAGADEDGIVTLELNESVMNDDIQDSLRTLVGGAISDTNQRITLGETIGAYPVITDPVERLILGRKHRREFRHVAESALLAEFMRIGVLSGVPPERLVEMRQKEREPFEQFRAEMARVAGDIQTAESLSSDDLQDILRTRVEPLTRDIEIKMSAMSKSLTQRLGVSALVQVLNLGVLLAEAIPQVAASALGTVSLLGVAGSVIDYLKEKAQLRAHSMYFVWKAEPSVRERQFAYPPS